MKALNPNAEAPELCASIAEIDSAARDLYLMHEVASAPSIQLEFLPLPGVPTDFDSVLYYSGAAVGNLTAFVLVERRARGATETENGRRQLYFDKPIVRESWIVTDATDEQRALMAGDYQYHLSQMQADCKPLELGDIALFVRSLQKLNSAK